MDAFNFVFSLFGLLLGLSVAEVLTGFARAMKRRRAVHLGLLTPLLAVFVMLDLTSFWEWIWSGRRFLDPGYGVMVIGVAVSGLYYLAASIVFPTEFGERSDFDAHYMQHHRQVLGAILVCNVITTGPVLIIRMHDVLARTWVETALYFGSLLVGIATRNKAVSIVVLALLIAVYGFAAVMSFVEPVPT